jgi:hypothetical protein
LSACRGLDRMVACLHGGGDCSRHSRSARA